MFGMYIDLGRELLAVVEMLLTMYVYKLSTLVTLLLVSKKNYSNKTFFMIFVQDNEKIRFIHSRNYAILTSL